MVIVFMDCPWGSGDRIPAQDPVSAPFISGNRYKLYGLQKVAKNGTGYALILEHAHRMTIAMNRGFCAMQSESFFTCCGGIGGTGCRDAAGSWRSSRGLARQKTGDYFTSVLSERRQKTQA
jgi:hypothetical protein